MTGILFNASGKIERNVLEALQTIGKEAATLGIPFFLVGAFARDLLLFHHHRIAPARMTMDIDLAVNVSNWDQYRTLTDALRATGAFLPAREQQRYFFRGHTPVDIVPFGGIGRDMARISWAPEQETSMSTIGFDEAFEHSLTARLQDDPVLDVRVATLPGLAMMKFISWKDAYPGRPKDADDILFIMREYENAGNRDRLFSGEPGLSLQRR